MSEQDLRIVEVRSLSDAAHETVDITGYDSYKISEPLHLDQSVPNYLKIPKSALSFTVLTSLAFKNADYNRLTVQQIFSFIKKHFSHILTTEKNWKNSVRNTLAMSPYFMKLIPCKSKSPHSSTLPSCSKDEEGLTWAVNPVMIVKMENLIIRSAALPGDSAGCSKVTLDDETVEHQAGDGIVKETVAPEQKPVVFTQYRDGVLPLVTLYAETPGDCKVYAANYPVQL